MMTPHTGQPTRIIGWDIGGAYVKAALLEMDGKTDAVILDAVKTPCPLWRGIDHLEATLARLGTQLGRPDCHGVTMTGELADIFPDRLEGVRRILKLVQSSLSEPGHRDDQQPRMMIYAGGRDFLDPAQAYKHPHRVASANWQALAAWTGDWVDRGLVVDIGSTTTDIIPLGDGRLQNYPQNRNLSDHERLRDAGLVYSGVVRTPLIALTPDIFFEGGSIPLMAEIFATTADIYRLLGWLHPHSDQAPTADGAGKTATDSARRLARMIGLDAAERPLAVWRDLADRFATIQRKSLRNACQRHIEHAALRPSDPIIGYGCGQFLIKKIAAELGHSYVAGETFLAVRDADLATRMAICGPAVAVAWLAAAPG